ncbi:MAG TPA: hypothetical protein VGI36_20215 [Candidatus Binataceae bacterium]|jgi:hypothetical protein
MIFYLVLLIALVCFIAVAAFRERKKKEEVIRKAALLFKENELNLDD